MTRHKRSAHPRKAKQFSTKETYRKFLAFTHMRTPSGKRAKSPSQSISGRTPAHRKERTVRIAGRLHRPVLSRSQPRRGR